MRLDSTNRSSLKSIAIVIFLIFAVSYLFKDRVSMYQPGPVDIQSVSEEPFSSLKSSPDCIDSVYSTSSGGVCGGQKLVRDHANYKIVG